MVQKKKQDTLDVPAKAPRKRTRRVSNMPTMAAVAAEAGVSVFTVSSVLNGTAAVRSERRERVLNAIKTTGYKRNSVARSLKTGRTMTIGVVVGEITNPFYTDVVAVLQQMLHKAGYAVMLCCNNYDVELQADHISLLRDRMVDGLVVSPVGEDAELQAALDGADIPVVLVDRIIAGPQYDAVLLDNEAAVGQAIHYLHSLGHRRIGLVSGLKSSFTGRERLTGYENALASAGFEVDPELIKLGRFRAEDAYNAALRLLTSADRPTAIFAANNLMLIGVMKAVHDIGLVCPDDISIVGLDDFAWTEAFDPQLTTVAQPVRQFGEQAAQMMLDRLGASKSAPPRHIILSGELRVRGSCRPMSNERTVSREAI